MRKIKAFLSVVALSLTALASFAQNVSLTGNIKDASTGEPIPFAAVVVKGTMNGAASDADGNYAITAPTGATLVFSSIGYESQEIAVAGKSVLNVALKPDAEALEGTIVIGYGSAKKVASLVGSSSFAFLTRPPKKSLAMRSSCSAASLEPARTLEPKVLGDGSLATHHMMMEG